MPPKIDTRTYFIPNSQNAARDVKQRRARKRPVKPTAAKYAISQYDWYFKMRQEFGAQNEEEPSL